METKVNDFKEDLKYSEEASQEDFWQAVYEKAFAGIVFAEPTTGKSQGQELGIDRVIYLNSGKIIYIDEKKRRQDWNDIALEYKHEGSGYNALGWMNKKLLIDYLAYAFMPSQTVYLLPWLSLKRVWVEKGKEWHELAERKESGFSISKAPNKNYMTHSICVPIPVLLKELLMPITISIKTF